MPDPEPLQTIRYPAEGDLQVEFRLPASWTTDLKLSTLALFYPVSDAGGPSPAGGLLAVNLDTRTFNPGLTPDEADAQVRANSKDPNDVLRLGPERWLIRGKSDKVELTHRSVVHVWVLVRLVRPDLLARIGFVFTGVDDLYENPGDPGYATVDLLDRQIEAARVIAADPPSRPAP